MRTETATTASLPRRIGVLWPAGSASGVLLTVLMVAGGVALLTLSAKIKVPFYPVPMTLQTLAVAVIAAAFGARRAVGVVLAYLAAGAAGLPVFTNTPPSAAGLLYMVGPTGGYLLGFVAAAALIGWLSERGWDRSFVTLFVAMVLGDAILLGLGVSWLAWGGSLLSVAPMLGLGKALAVGLYPFVLAALLKEALGAAIIRGASAALSRLTPPGL
jgi:biotin transport system substrate-specific component